MKKFNLNKVNKMVKAGLKNGLITISDDLFDYGVMGIGCKIGNKAFYFGDNEVENTMSLEEYKSSFDEEVTTEMVSNTIWNMISSEEYSEEGWYYIYYLDENKVVTLLLETYDDKNNFINIEFSVPSSWLEKYIDSSTEDFLNDYTSEESENIYAHAILDNAIIAKHFSF